MPWALLSINQTGVMVFIKSLEKDCKKTNPTQQQHTYPPYRGGGKCLPANEGLSGTIYRMSPLCPLVPKCVNFIFNF